MHVKSTTVAICKWLLKRLVFLKKEVIQLYDRLIYQPESRFLLHPWHAHRCPYEAVLFYSFVGRVLYATREFLALLSNGKLWPKTIRIEGYEQINSHISDTGNNLMLWPPSVFLMNSKKQIPFSFWDKIENAYHLAKTYYPDPFTHTKDWEKAATTFHNLLFNEQGRLNKALVQNFRKEEIFEQTVGDTFTYVDQKQSYFEAYLKAIDLVLSYHRLAAVVPKEVLAALSESHAGAPMCVEYRGLRLSEKLLFYALATGDLLRHIPYSPAHHYVLDIGAGYGTLAAILKNYIPKSTYILVDLPEVLVFAAYYLKETLPNASIGLLDDLDHLDDANFKESLAEYDFLLIPPAALKKIPSKQIDLVISTASMGFLTQESLSFYLTQIDRLLCQGGHFYSINKTETCQWGIGMYEWNFKSSYATILYAFNNRFSYLQWLGRKLNT